jgi:hypothetical protein
MGASHALPNDMDLNVIFTISYCDVADQPNSLSPPVAQLTITPLRLPHASVLSVRVNVRSAVTQNHSILHKVDRIFSRLLTQLLDPLSQQFIAEPRYPRRDVLY